jgi:hypothetical protein
MVYRKGRGTTQGAVARRHHRHVREDDPVEILVGFLAALSKNN